MLTQRTTTWVFLSHRTILTKNNILPASYTSHIYFPIYSLHFCFSPKFLSRTLPFPIYLLFLTFMLLIPQSKVLVDVVKSSTTFFWSLFALPFAVPSDLPIELLFSDIETLTSTEPSCQITNLCHFSDQNKDLLIHPLDAWHGDGDSTVANIPLWSSWLSCTHTRTYTHLTSFLHPWFCLIAWCPKDLRLFKSFAKSLFLKWCPSSTSFICNLFDFLVRDPVDMAEDSVSLSVCSISSSSFHFSNHIFSGLTKLEGGEVPLTWIFSAIPIRKILHSLS